MNEKLRLIQQAINQKQPVSFTYFSKNATVYHNAVYPFKLYKKSNNIYFDAHCYFVKDIRTFRLDRVAKLRITENKKISKDQEKKEIFRFVLVVLILLIVFGSGYSLWTLSGGNPKGKWVLVTRVVDGDTIKVGRGWRENTVRLIGVDTPETVHPYKDIEYFGPEASKFTKEMVLKKKVHLEFESRIKHDRYGRLLAYVFLPDRTFLNALIIKEGYGQASAPHPFKYYRKFQLHQLEAIRAKKGMWSKK